MKERLYRFNYVSAAARHSARFFGGTGLTGWDSVCAGSTRSARRKGAGREVRRDVSERLRGLSEDLGDVAMTKMSSETNSCGRS